YAQDVTLIKKNASLEKIFEDLYQQTGYQFVYSYDLMKKAKKVNVNAKDKPLKEVLENCFKNQPFTYKIRGNAVVVKKRSDKDIFSKLLKHEMIQREVHGTIIDSSTREPLAGVTIKVIGSNRGTTTNVNGEFKLNLPRDSKLRIS